MRILPKSVLWFLIPLALLLPSWVASGYGSNTILLGATQAMKEPLKAICDKFSQKSKYVCKVNTAASGHLYSHVMEGIHYDLIVSSDDTYTQGLINAQRAYATHRFVFAKERIVLWSADPAISPAALPELLKHSDNTLVTISNPSISPNGRSSKELLQSHDLWGKIQKRLVYGNSSWHAYDMVSRKQTPIGFVPLSRLSREERVQHRYWEPNSASYHPVVHEAVMLKQCDHIDGTLAFLSFLKSPESCQMLQEAGFECASKVS